MRVTESFPLRSAFVPCTPRSHHSGGTRTAKGQLTDHRHRHLLPHHFALGCDRDVLPKTSVADELNVFDKSQYQQNTPGTDPGVFRFASFKRLTGRNFSIVRAPQGRTDAVKRQVVSVGADPIAGPIVAQVVFGLPRRIHEHVVGKKADLRANRPIEKNG